MDRGAARTPSAPSIMLRYIGQDGVEHEIATWDALVRAVLDGAVTDETLIQMPSWVKAGHHAGFQVLKSRIVEKSDGAPPAGVAARPIEGVAWDSADMPRFFGRGTEAEIPPELPSVETAAPNSPVIDFDRLKHAHRPERNPFVGVERQHGDVPELPAGKEPSKTPVQRTPESPAMGPPEPPPWRGIAPEASDASRRGAGSAMAGGAADKPIFAPAEIIHVEQEIRGLARSIGLFSIFAAVPILLIAVFVARGDALGEIIAARRWAPLFSGQGTEVWFQNWAATLDFGASIAAVVVFLVAGHRARRIAEDLLIYGYRWSYLWTVLGLFVPVVNFFRPWLGFGELQRALANAARIGRIGSHWRRGFSDAALLLALAWIGTVAALIALQNTYAAEAIPESRMVVLLTMEFVARLIFLIVSAGFLAQLHGSARLVLENIARPRMGVAGVGARAVSAA